ncbi:kinase-like domain-containing protein [Suillus lakei]|nr:kinase-like domain-containing protein [Suillus lakei]
MNHENIARLLGVTSGFGHPDTSISMVSTWFPNGTLTIFLASPHDTFNRRQRLELLQGIAAGVLYLHTSEVVHGNLSGNNVLIDNLGKARLTDFGLSAASGGFRGASYLGQAGRPGAIRWAAPELIDGQHSTFESDIYSFGSIMLQVLSGELPWSEVEFQDDPRVSLETTIISFGNVGRQLAHCLVHLPPESTTFISVWRSPDSALRHAVRSVIRWIKIRTASPAPRCPAEGSDGAFQVLNDAAAIHEKTEPSSGPGMDCKGTQSQPSITGGGAIYPTRTLATAPGPLALPLRTTARPLFYNSKEIPNENITNDAFVYDDTRSNDSDVDNLNEHPIVRQNGDTNQQSSLAIANTSTHPNLKRKARPQDFEGDLVNHIIRLHDFAVVTGGFGEIWHCDLHRAGSGKVQVAVQVIHLDPARPWLKTELVKRHREWLKLEQGNLVRFYGLTSNFDVFPALVTAWMCNGTLTQYLGRQYPFLSASLKFSLVKDISSGLCYLHSKHIVHGQLTGFNVLIDENGRAYLANYHLADILFTHYSVVQEPRWTDPELLRVDNSRVPTMSADVYAFGCIMLQILIGKLPYWWATRNIQVIMAKLDDVLPMRYDPDIPKLDKRHEAFLNRCWALPHRPSSAEAAEFVAAELRTLDEP